MDIVKITARNIFFRQFKSFRPLYGNFRNDHVMLRELTRAPGFVLADEKRMTVFLCPAITVQPKVRENIQLFPDQASVDIWELKGRKLEFRLCGLSHFFNHLIIVLQRSVCATRL